MDIHPEAVAVMTRSAFLRLLENLLERPVGSLRGAENLESLNWDSLKGLEFLVLVDETFDGYQLPPELLADVKIVDDLIGALAGRVS